MFTEEDGTNINNEDKKEFKVRKMLRLSQFVIFKEL